ncbi:chorismate mutase [Denitrobacterium detoxificans]|nr:chorismate mutase [Denitrobacterium detoxificans]
MSPTETTEEPENFEHIQEHRAQIDAIDKQLVALLNERATHQLAIRALKPGAHMGLFDPKREEEIFARVQEYNQGPLYPDNLREIYATILKVSKEMPSA